MEQAGESDVGSSILFERRWPRFMRNRIPDYISDLELDLCRLGQPKARQCKLGTKAKNLYAQSGLSQIVCLNRLHLTWSAFPSCGSTPVTLSYSALLPNNDCLSRGRQWTPQSYLLRRRKSGIMTWHIYSCYWQSFWEHSSS